MCFESLTYSNNTTFRSFFSCKDKLISGVKEILQFNWSRDASIQPSSIHASSLRNYDQLGLELIGSATSNSHKETTQIAANKHENVPDHENQQPQNKPTFNPYAKPHFSTVVKL